MAVGTELGFALRPVANERLQLAALSPFGQPADDGVSESPAARELDGLVGATGELEHGLRPRPPDRLVPAERGREVAAGCEPVGEHGGILDRLGRALADAPGRRVWVSPTRTTRPSLRRGSGLR
jgi:hypothetical protein